MYEIRMEDITWTFTIIKKNALLFKNTWVTVWWGFVYDVSQGIGWRILIGPYKNSLLNKIVDPQKTQWIRGKNIVETEENARWLLFTDTSKIRPRDNYIPQDELVEQP